MPSRRLAVLAVVALLTAACSSTNIRDRERALRVGRAGPGAPTAAGVSEGGPEAGAEAGPDATSPGGSAATNQPRPGGSATATGPGGAGATAPGSPRGNAAPGPGGSPPPGSVGPGVSATEINIGISLFKAGDYGAAFGIKGIDFGNTEAQAQAVVDHLNANGGIAGRKIKPIYYTLDFGRPGLSDGQSEQEACAKWTEDNKVFAAVNSVMARTALLVCLASRGVPGVHDGLPEDEATIEQYRGFFYQTMAISLDRQAANEVEVLGQQGFWKNAVVGIEYFEDKAYRRVVDEVYIPRLKAYGVTKFVLQGAPRGGTEGASYAARFQREGVTHVLFIGEASLYPLFFMRGAENQLYYPKYSLNSGQQLASTLQGAAPPAQLANASAVGWFPVSDTDASHDPGPPNAKTTQCFDIQRKAGQDMSARGAALTALGYCSALFFFRDALAKAPSVTAAGLQTAVNGLGGSYVSPANYGTFFGPKMHTGVSRYRDLRYRNGAFVYTSEVKALPV